MNKLELTTKGDLSKRAFLACIKWLAIGGSIELKSGHKLAMSPDGGIGFLATRTDTITKKTDEIIFQIDSDIALTSLKKHADDMTNNDLFTIAANVTLNENKV